MGQEVTGAGGHDRKRTNLTKLERAIDALYRGRCNLIQACNLAEVDQEVMKRFLLDKVNCTPTHPIQLTLDFRDQDS